MTKKESILESAVSESGGIGSETAYRHPTNITEFENIYRREYTQEMESCDRWIKWCEKENDSHGMSFHEGMRASLVFNNIKTLQLIRVLKHEHPNK